MGSKHLSQMGDNFPGIFYSQFKDQSVLRPLQWEFLYWLDNIFMQTLPHPSPQTPSSHVHHIISPGEGGVIITATFMSVKQSLCSLVICCCTIITIKLAIPEKSTCQHSIIIAMTSSVLFGERHPVLYHECILSYYLDLLANGVQ